MSTGISDNAGSNASDNGSNGISELSALFGRALTAWRQRGRLADLLGPILEWFLEEAGAERAIFVTVLPGGGIKVRSSRDTDGESVADAQRSLSPHVVRRALEQREASFFSDTLHDRRFRTEVELETGVRVRSVLAVPVRWEDEQGILYLDARFKAMRWPGSAAAALPLLTDLIAVGLRHDALERRARGLEREVKRSGALAERARASVVEPARSAPSLRTGLRELDFHGFRTCCPELLGALEEIERLAPSTIAVLVEGESGTGKEVLARAIHEASGRAGPFVSLHCGAVPESLVETELFGHVRGAFTGADKDRAGLFDLARGGTIFLDDIGEMPPAMQFALLRVLETGRFRPVSGETEREADVRVISAALLAPGESAEAEGPRSDLYYRLAGATVRVPPLRMRREDILLLARHFIERHGDRGDALRIPPEVESELVAYDWPGNVRELENLLRRVIALGDEVFTLERFEQITGSRATDADGPTVEAGSDMQSIVDRAEREAIIRALLQASGNKSRAAKLLGLSRKTLYRRMEKHGIPL